MSRGRLTRSLASILCIPVLLSACTSGGGHPTSKTAQVVGYRQFPGDPWGSYRPIYVEEDEFDDPITIPLPELGEPDDSVDLGDLEF